MFEKNRESWMFIRILDSGRFEIQGKNPAFSGYDGAFRGKDRVFKDEDRAFRGHDRVFKDQDRVFRGQDPAPLGLTIVHSGFKIFRNQGLRCSKAGKVILGSGNRILHKRIRVRHSGIKILHSGNKIAESMVWIQDFLIQYELRFRELLGSWWLGLPS